MERHHAHRTYTIVVTVTIATLAVEVVGVRHTNSAGLYADALHLLGDLVPLLLGWWALAARSKRLEGMTTLLNILLLFGAGVFIGKEALDRYVVPEAVDADMLWFSLASVVGNGLQWHLSHGLHGAHDHAHTGESQIWHLLMDFAASGAVFVGAIALYATGFVWPDLAAASMVMALSFVGGGIMIYKFLTHKHHHH